MRDRFVNCFLLVAGFFFVGLPAVHAQVGLSVSPPRLYYSLDPGETGSHRVLVANVSKGHPLDLSLTLGDWKYDDYGNNLILPPDSLGNSCAGWLSLPGGTYMTLGPGEKREVALTMAVPAHLGREANVQAAMLFVTQMNPVDGVDTEGASIRINVRQGIKVYRKGNAAEIRKVEIERLAYDRETNSLLLSFSNKGNIWIDGSITASLFNHATGKESHLDAPGFYTMPGDLRIMQIPCGDGLAKGQYTAAVMLDYGDRTTIEAAELHFGHD